MLTMASLGGGAEQVLCRAQLSCSKTEIIDVQVTLGVNKGLNMASSTLVECC